MHSIDISYASLAVGLLLLLVPAYYIWRYETGLLKSICVGAVRMIFQMLFIGVYLRYLFQWDNPWVNCLWVLISALLSARRHWICSMRSSPSCLLS